MKARHEPNAQITNRVGRLSGQKQIPLRRRFIADVKFLERKRRGKLQGLDNLSDRQMEQQWLSERQNKETAELETLHQEAPVTVSSETGDFRFEKHSTLNENHFSISGCLLEATRRISLLRRPRAF